MIEQSEEIIVVTGASGALGEAVVEHLLSTNRRVVGWDLESPGGGLLVPGEKSGLSRQKVDVTDANAVEKAVNQVEADLGAISAMIHLAGGFRWSMIDEIDVEDIDFLVDVNLRSGLYIARSVMKRFKARGKGRLVLISSRSTLAPGAGEGAYAATKAGLNALITSLAAEVKDIDVTVNGLQPSIINTAANREAMPEADFSTWVPRSHLAKIIAFLLSEEGASISGATLVVSGRT